MSDWPSSPNRPSPKARAARQPVPGVGTGGAGNARASTPKQRRRQLELIEVRLRPERAARLRTQRFFVWTSVALLVAALAGGGYWAATRGASWLFFKNPDYNVSVLHVETDGVLAQEAILEAADVREGMNIFKLDLDRARARIETLPQVERASVRRQLPNEVSITVNERKPVAWVAPDSGAKTRDEVFASPRALLVDATGMLLKPRKVLAQNYTLPIIRNANAERLAPGQRVDSEPVRATLDLLRAHQNSLVGARFQITEIDLARGYGLLVTDRNGLQVLFGLDDPEVQLKTLDALLTSIAASGGGRRPATISLMTMEARQRNIPVTFQPDAPPAPPAAEAANSASDRVAANSAPPPSAAGGNHPKKEPASPGPAGPGRESEKSRGNPKPHGGGSSKHHEERAPKPHAREHHPAPRKPAPSEPGVRRALPVIQPFQPAPGR